MKHGRARHTWRSLGLAVLVLLSLWPSGQLHAFDARLLLVSAPSVPARLRGAVQKQLSKLGELIDADEYAAAASDARLAPHSPEALSRIAPSMHVRVIVVLHMSRRKLVVSYRDGRTGRVLNSTSLGLRHNALNSAAQRELRFQTRNVLAAQTGSAASPSPSSNEPAPPMAADMRADLSPEEPPEQSPPDSSPFAATESSNDSWSGQESAGSAEPDSLAPSTQPTERLGVRAGFGFGFGQRAVHVPSAVGERRLDTSPFPALDLWLQAEAPLGTHALLAAQAHYQTSLGVVATSQPPGTTQPQSSLRSHRIDLGLLPSYRFVPNTNSVTLGVLLGWSVHGLRPVVDLTVPANTFHGPILRPELRIPIADSLLVLRLAPEAMLIAYVSGALRSMSGSARAGLAWGGEVSLDVRLAELVYIKLSYRESRASVATSWSTELTDVERFATLTALLRY